MTDLKDQLERLGLSHYLETFTAEGFDTWDTVLDITESDLSHLNVKLGHRRKLQRAIAESRSKSSDVPLAVALRRASSVDDSYRSGDDSATENRAKSGDASATGSAAAGPIAKRKYRRHPKSDEHAPERPPSAYVIFSNQIREQLKGQDLSFTEIAKIVGARWQVLPAEDREACERQANNAKEKYYAELAEYKKTPQYDAYQKYLEDFRAKHAAPQKDQSYGRRTLSNTMLTKASTIAETKRPKLESDTSTSTRSSSHDRHERAANRRLSSTQLDASSTCPPRAGSSPPIGPSRFSSTQSISSKPASPTSHTLSSLNSPRVGDQYSPVSTSPRSVLFDGSLGSSTRDTRGPEVSYSYQPAAFSYPSHPPASTTPPSHAFTSLYHGPNELSRRRTPREPTRLPPLTHEDTTWSSESGHSASVPPAGFVGPALPLNSSKTLRILPQPVPSIGPNQSPLDRPPPSVPPVQAPVQNLDYRAQGPLAVLVRAGELAAKSTEDEAMDESSP